MLQDLILVPDVVNGLCLKHCLCTINLLHHLDKISEFITVLFAENLSWQQASQLQGVVLRDIQREILPCRGLPY